MGIAVDAGGPVSTEDADKGLSKAQALLAEAAERLAGSSAGDLVSQQAAADLVHELQVHQRFRAIGMSICTSLRRSAISP